MGYLHGRLHRHAWPPPPSSPFQFHPTPHLTHEDILLGTLDSTSWTWANKTQTPILGSLRSTVGLRRLATYTHDRDAYRARRSAPPIWASSSARFAAALWRLPRPGLRTRALACRTLWDHRWHGENQSIAATGYNLDVPLTRCPLCGGYWSQHHVLRQCNALHSQRLEANSDLALAISRLKGPTRRLADSYTTLLLPASPREPASTAQLWTGLWPPSHRALLGPALAACSLREATSTLQLLGHLAVVHCIRVWFAFYDMAKALLPHDPPPFDPDPDPDSAWLGPPPDTAPPEDPLLHSPSDQTDWDPRFGEDHG